MTDSPNSPPTTSLAEQALERFNSVAKGNDIAPDFIKLIDKNEAVYMLIGKMILVPNCDAQTNQYLGSVKGKGKQVFPSIAAMRQAAMEKQQAMMREDKWIAEAVAELAAAPGQGWGADGAKVTLPSQTVTLAATDNCPTCTGSGQITCTQCRGQKRTMCLYCKGQSQEQCPNCYGKGEDPVNPGKPCLICNGTRLAPCRYCHGTGWMPCQACQGKGGTQCTICKGIGKITEEISLTGHAQTNFHISKDQEFPSGLLRGIDRIGTANLEKGHADITMRPPAEDKEDKTAKYTVRYTAKIPYADLKLRFGDDRIVMVSSFGKKGLLLGCPLFLDKALAHTRELLASAAKGEIPLEDAMITRVARDALSIELSGRNIDPANGAKELRKIYPIGLSPVAIREILRNISTAIGLATRKSRVAASSTILFLSTVGFWWLFFTPAHANIMSGLSKELSLAADTAILVAALGLARVALWQSARVTLSHAFPKEKLRIKQNIGKVGNGLLAVVFAVYVTCLWFAPTKPWWFSFIAGG